MTEALPAADLRPPSLQAGDGIALTTPLNLPPARFQNHSRLIAYAAERGLRCSQETARSDTPSQRAASFNAAIRLGYRALLPLASNRYGDDILKRIDYQAFAEQRPIFTTFSAGSTMLGALHEQTGVPVFYGPHLRFVAEDEVATGGTGVVSEAFWSMLGSAKEITVLPNIFSRPEMPPNRRTSIPFVGLEADSREMPSGKLLPMFLQSLQYCVNARIIPDVTGRIIITESDQIGFDEALRRLQAIHQKVGLNHAAALCVAAITPHPLREIGSALTTELYSPTNAQQFVANIRRIVGEDLPVVYGFPMGHGPIKYTVPYGTEASLHTVTGDITLLEQPLVRSGNTGRQGTPVDTPSRLV